MKRSNPLSMLLPGNHGCFLRDFAYDVGCTASILLLEFLELDDYFSDSYASHPVHGDGWFYATEEKIERRTGIRRKQQEADIRTLKNLNFIEMKVFGLPASRYFRINKKKVAEYFGIQGNFLDCTKSHSSNNNLKNRSEKCENGDEKSSKKHSRMDKSTNCDVPKDKLRPYYTIHKEPKEEPKEIHAPPCGAPNSQTFLEQKSPPKIPTTKPHPNVEVTVDEHAKLVDKFGIELVTEGYADLSEWKHSADPKVVAKHKSDYRRLRKWVIPNLLEENQKNERIKQQNIAPHRRGSKLVTQGDYDSVAPKLNRF